MTAGSTLMAAPAAPLRGGPNEEAGLTDSLATAPAAIDLRDPAAYPLGLDEVDVDALPVEHRDLLIWQRLARMRPGDAVRLTSASDLHPVWRRQYACNHNSHIWVYEECGPARFRVRVTRRSLDDY